MDKNGQLTRNLKKNLYLVYVHVIVIKKLNIAVINLRNLPYICKTKRFSRKIYKDIHKTFSIEIYNLTSKLDTLTQSKIGRNRFYLDLK